MFNIVWTKRNRLQNLTKQLDRLDKQYVDYGFFQEQGIHPRAKMSYAQLMAMHENRPNSDPMRRPVFEASLDKSGDRLVDTALAGLAKYNESSAAAKRPSPDALLRKIGREGVAITKPTFGDPSILRSNTVGVIARKGGDTPMVEFGTLRNKLAVRTSLKKAAKKS
tara:strand:+ start:688 stop:1185 length:498 start_codon:yes stop_codon:yes gene_type:complete